MFKTFRHTLTALTLLAALSAQALDLPVKDVNGKRYYFYEVKYGDTVYSLAKSLGISRDDIINNNPAAADGLRAGSMLYFPYDKFADSGAAYIEHEVKRGETLFGLAHRYGTTPDDIVAANPAAINGLRAGEVIRIPTDNPEATSVPAAQPASEPNETPLYVPEPVPAPIVTEEAPAPTPAPEEDTIASDSAEVADTAAISVRAATIAVVLPFALTEETPSKQTKLITDFYRGILLAAEAGSHSGTTVSIKAYDSKNLTPDVFLAEASVVIAPEDSATMASLAAAAAESDTYILNTFNLKDETYKTDPSVVQMNIPHTAMYERAYQAMRERYGDTQPVLLHSTSGRNEKSAFTNYIRSRYISDGIAPEELAYSGTLLSSDLDRLDPAGRYVVVPSSGTLAEFNKMSHALKAFREDPASASIEIFGYPDWTAFRNDARDMLHELGATVYTRVFFDPESDTALQFNSDFTREFGAPSMEVVPNQGALGYDVAAMVIDNLRANGGVFDPEDTRMVRGKQSVFRFVRAGDSDGGFYNDALLIVSFQPDKSTQVSAL